MKNKSILWLTTTALFLALVIGSQAAASGQQFIAGPLVNLILIVSVMTCGLSSGLTVAMLSPLFAKLLGIGPLWTIIPFIMAGNAALVLIWYLLSKLQFNRHALRAISAVLAAGCKFAVLYLGIVRIALPWFLPVNEQQATVISGMFSVPQFFTALMGGALAMAILPLIEKVKKNRN